MQRDQIKAVFLDIDNTLLSFTGYVKQAMHGIIIGDSMSSDIAGGAAYGMHTCLYLPTAKRKGTPDAETVIGNLREIQRVLP